MHELSLVEELVVECARRAGGRTVTLARVRCPVTIELDEVEQAFQVLTAGGPLAAARLEIESFSPTLACGCGFSGPLGKEDTAGHMLVCPRCAAVHESHDALELVTVELAG
jgi:Zn finger protein HypA/HybF involved in hydrogenase expression